MQKFNNCEKWQIKNALKFHGFHESKINIVEVLETGAVYLGLIEILPKNSIKYKG